MPRTSVARFLSALIGSSLALGCAVEEEGAGLALPDDSPSLAASADPPVAGEVRVSIEEPLTEISNPATLTGGPVEAGDGVEEEGRYRAVGPARGEVWLFQNAFYGGWKRIVTGTDLASVGSSYDDQISSLKVGPDTCVTLYQHASYGGNYKSYCNDILDLAAFGMNDLVSSVRTYPSVGWLWLYTGTAYSGSMSAYNCDIAALPTAVASIKVGYLSSATLSKLYNWGGQTFEIRAHTPNLAAVGITGVSSLRVLPAAGWAWLYDSCYYVGDMLPIPWSITVLYIFGKPSGGGDFDNAIESLKVGPNTVARLYEHPDFGGWVYESNSSVACLPTSYRNQATSAVVEMRSW
jgi:hypothetical protein